MFYLKVSKVDIQGHFHLTLRLKRKRSKEFIFEFRYMYLLCTKINVYSKYEIRSDYALSL